VKALWLAVLCAAAARADMVFLNDGRELSGAVKSVDARKVSLDSGGQTQEYPRGDVLKVKLVRSWGVPGEDAPAKIADGAVRALLKSPPDPGAYPDDASLRALEESVCEIGKDLSATCVLRVVTLVLRERGKDAAANARIYSLEGAERARLDYARTITAGKVSNLDDNAIEEGSELAQYPAYDRLRSVKFALPDVSTGSVLDYRYRVESRVDVSTFPFLEQWSFRGGEPSSVSRLVVVAPTGVPLNYAERLMPPDAKFSRSEKDGRVRLSWEVRASPALKQEGSMPPMARIVPTVTVAPAASWRGEAAVIAPLVDARLALGPELAAEEARLLRGLATDAAKVEALYDWVVREIKYQPVYMQQSSYVPRTPAEIYKAKAGNMLDKPFLLDALLAGAGFKPSLLYFPLKSDSVLEESVPNLRQLSAASVAVEAGGRRVFLTPFEDVQRWDEHPGWLQGMPGLVVHGPGLGTFLTLPQAPAEEETEDFSSKLALKADGSIGGSAVIRVHGQHQANWRGLKDWKKEDVDQWMEKMIHGIHPNARLLAYSMENLDDPTRDIVVHAAYEIKDYAITASGGYIAFRVPWTERGAGDVGKPSRETPVFRYARERTTDKASIDLPAGYSLYYAAPPVDLQAGGDSYRASIKARPGGLEFSDESVSGELEIPAGDYARYKAFREESARFTQKWIVLKKEGAAVSEK
jgi:hypothetical protein